MNDNERARLNGGRRAGSLHEEAASRLSLVREVLRDWNEGVGLDQAANHMNGRAALDGDAEAAAAADQPLARLHMDLFVESNPIPVKWALARLGRIPTGLRLPLTELSTSAQPNVAAALDAAGLSR